MKFRRIKFCGNLREKSLPIKQTAESSKKDETIKLEFMNKGNEESRSLSSLEGDDSVNDGDEINVTSEVIINVNPLALSYEENDSAP